MNNKILFTIVLSVMIALIFVPIFTENENKNEKYEYVESHIEDENIETEEEYVERIINEMQVEMDSISNIKDKKEWFCSYKNIVEKYSDVLGQPENIYDCFSNDELNLLFRIVEAEATEGGFLEKANVASVIFNRLGNDAFGNTLDEILVQSQFSPLRDGRAYQVEITEDTILACEYAFMIEDTTSGAIYFESEDSNVHASYAEYLFTDKVGHKFYK